MKKIAILLFAIWAAAIVFGFFSDGLRGARQLLVMPFHVVQHAPYGVMLGLKAIGVPYAIGLAFSAAISIAGLACRRRLVGQLAAAAGIVLLLLNAMLGLGQGG